MVTFIFYQPVWREATERRIETPSDVALRCDTNVHLVGIEGAYAESIFIPSQLREQDRGQSGRQPSLLQRSLHFLKLFLSNLSSGKAKLQDLKRILWRSWRDPLIGCNWGCGSATHLPEILLNDPGNVIRPTSWEVVQD